LPSDPGAAGVPGEADLVDGLVAQVVDRQGEMGKAATTTSAGDRPPADYAAGGGEAEKPRAAKPRI
jgi:hypothetical protein